MESSNRANVSNALGETTPIVITSAETETETKQTFDVLSKDSEEKHQKECDAYCQCDECCYSKFSNSDCIVHGPDSNYFNDTEPSDCRCGYERIKRDPCD